MTDQSCATTTPHLTHGWYDHSSDVDVIDHTECLRDCPGVPWPAVNLSGEDVRRLFDLAVDSPLICSGSFESDDVDLLRRIATALGTDPDAITPDEFIANYVHTFVPPPPFEAVLRVVREHGSGPLENRGIIRRNETPEEYGARRAASQADACHAGTYGRRCNRPAADERHRR